MHNTVWDSNLSNFSPLGPGFNALINFMYADKETTVKNIKDLDLLFELYRLADKEVE